MQTFLPAWTYESSARALDNKRLGKQRVECLQILQIIGRKQGWLPNPDNKSGFWNHPAVKMWENYPHALKCYTIAVCQEWVERGYNDTVQDKVLALPIPHGQYYPSWYEVTSPDAELLVFSHRSNLVRKLPSHYLQYFPDSPPNLPYHWPK